MHHWLHYTLYFIARYRPPGQFASNIFIMTPERITQRNILKNILISNRKLIVIVFDSIGSEGV